MIQVYSGDGSVLEKSEKGKTKAGLTLSALLAVNDHIAPPGTEVQHNAHGKSNAEACAIVDRLMLRLLPLPHVHR